MSIQDIVGGRFCVTGAAGFIGSHLCERLLDLGASVVGVDCLTNLYDPSLKEANLRRFADHPQFLLYRSDLQDPRTSLDAVHGCRAVIHLAALPGIGPSRQMPARYQENNVVGTTHLLEACRLRDVPGFIFASSSSVYGDCDVIPFSEDGSAVRPLSVYGATKAAGEVLCRVYHDLFGLDVTSLRLFTVYGPRQRPDMAIHKFARLISGGKPVTLYGDGTMERDFTYVEDIVEGIVASLGTLPGSGSRLINLGTDRPVALNDLIAALEAALGLPAEVVFQPAPPGEAQRTWADVSRAREQLGYEARTSLARGLENFVGWYRDEGPGAR